MKAVVIPFGLVAALLMCHAVSVSAATAPGPDAFGYTVAQTTNFTFLQITNFPTTHVLYFDDDSAYTNANLGFTFNFYGTNYTNVSFNVNGLMTFGGASTNFLNVNLTTTSPSNNLPAIAVLWDDWETKFNGHPDGVYFKTIGTAGSRQFIVQWNKIVPVNGDGVDDVTFEARLFEGSNKILLSYLDTVVSDETTSPPNAASQGVGATVGIRDLNGQSNNRNLLWSHNQAVITNGQNILFSRPNTLPTAVNDVAATAEDTPVTISVLGNDSDADGNPLTVTAATQGARSAVTINPDSTVRFAPATNYNGMDSFTYTISDGQGGTAMATVTVTVTPVNDRPVASPDAYTVDEDLLLTVPAPGVLANDSDVDGDLLVAMLVAGPTHGTLAFNTNGSFLYRPNTNFNGTDSFVCKASDGSLNSSNATVTITVNPVNDPPVAGRDYSDAHQEIPLTLTNAALLSNDFDVEGDILEITNVSATTTSGGSVNWSGNSITYTPPPDFTGTDTFTYTVNDGHGGVDTGTVEITVRPPLEVISIARLANGNVAVQFHGIPSRSYHLQASTDLASWTDVGTRIADASGNFDFEDTGADSQSQAFYRVLSGW